MNSPRLRILHIHGKYFAFGGAETYLHALRAEQQAAGHHTAIVYCDQPPAEYSAPADEFFLGSSYGLRSGLAIAKSFLRSIDNWQPDILHLHVTHFALSAFLLKKLCQRYPNIHTVHDTLSFCYKEVNADSIDQWARMMPDGTACNYGVGQACFSQGCSQHFMKERGLRYGLSRILHVQSKLKAYRQIDRFLLNSQFIKEDLIRNGFSPHRLQVHYLTPDIPSAWQETLKRPPHHPKTEAQLLYVGKLSSLKGIRPMLQALSQIVDLPWHCTLIGGGPESNSFQEDIHQAGLSQRVTITPSVSREQLGHYYAQSDILLFPSIWPEPFGLVGPEAMLFGLPTVAFDVGGVCEWLSHNQSGFLIQPSHTADFAQSIRQLIDDKDLYQRMSQHARQQAPSFFGMSSHAALIDKEYQKVIQSRQKKLA